MSSTMKCKTCEHKTKSIYLRYGYNKWEPESLSQANGMNSQTFVAILSINRQSS